MLLHHHLIIRNFFENVQKCPKAEALGHDFRKGPELLADDLGDNAGTDGTATLTDSEPQALLDSDRGDQLHAHHDVIAGHAHLNTLGQSDDAGHVSGTEVELRTIVGEEGR